MPRLRPWLLRKARAHSRDLEQLLFACRSLNSAKQELRWINEHYRRSSPMHRPSLVSTACSRRGRGLPLQYILGSQPFGSLDIQCRPGVLIPRAETEAYTMHLAKMIKSNLLFGEGFRETSSSLGIIDFCTGTGCIPLQLFDSLRQSTNPLHVCGVDLSHKAVDLSKANIRHNRMLSCGSDQNLNILQGDVFDDQLVRQLSAMRWDVMISNPPYISVDVWENGRGQMGYSVRKFEPKIALVPGNHLPVASGWQPADVFYKRLWDIADALRPQALLFELGDGDQAYRVISCLLSHETFRASDVQIWRDWPDMDNESEGQRELRVTSHRGHQKTFPIVGSGSIRSLLIRKR